MRSIEPLVRSTLLIAALLALVIAGPATAQYRQQSQPALLPLPETLLEELPPRVRGQVIRARQELQAAVPAGGQPDLVELAAAFGLMGKTALAYGLAPLAEASLENARTLEPDNTLWSYLSGVLYEGQERWQEAAAAFESVLAVTAEDSLAQFRLARALARSAATAQGSDTAARRARAKAQLERTTKNSATASAARYELARLNGDLTAKLPAPIPDPRLEAVLALQKSAGMVTGSTHSDPLDKIRLLLQKGESARAVSESRRLVQAAPDNASARLLLGRALAINGDREAALAQYRDLLDRHPDRRSQGLAHLRIARILDPEKPNETPPAEVLNNYRKAVELIPKFSNARLALADALMRSSQFDLAIEQLVAMNEAQPDDPASYIALSKALTRTGRHPQAHAVLRQGFERLPSHPLIGYNYGRSLALSPALALRDGNQALSLLLPIFQQQPSLAHAEAVAAALATASNFKDAERWQTRVIQQAQEENAKPRYLDLLQRNLDLYKAGKPQP